MATRKKIISRRKYTDAERKDTIARLQDYRTQHPDATIVASVNALGMQDHPGLKNARQWLGGRAGAAKFKLEMPMGGAIPLEAIPPRPAPKKQKGPRPRTLTDIERQAAADAAHFRQLNDKPEHYNFAVELLEMALRILRGKP